MAIKTCLICDRASHVRGLCQTCYRSAYKRVKRGVCTWEELEDLGLVIPPHSNAKLSKFSLAYEKAIAAKGK